MDTMGLRVTAENVQIIVIHVLLPLFVSRVRHPDTSTIFNV